MVETLDIIRENKNDIRWVLIGIISGAVVFSYLFFVVWTVNIEYTVVSQDVIYRSDIDKELLELTVISVENGLTETYTLYADEYNSDILPGDNIMITWTCDKFAGYQKVET